MRLITLVILIAGCTAAPTAGPQEEEPATTENPAAASAFFDPSVVVAGNFAWHDASNPSPNAAIGQVEYVGQTVVPGCLDPATGEPDGWNLRLSPVTPVTNGTTSLDVKFSWDPSAYIRDELVLAYQPAGATQWQLSPYIKNGQNHTIDVQPKNWEPAEAASQWRYAACLVREEHRNVDAGADWRPGAFRGMLRVDIKTVQ